MTSAVCSGKVRFQDAHTEARGVVLNHGDALIIVDVQRDLLSGGSLAVHGGDEVIAPLNRYQAMFVPRNLPIFLSGDCHPADHCSFKAQGGPWPPHCVANTRGAAFAEQLTMPDSAVVVRKGQRADDEAYSAFDGTDLADRLRNSNIFRVFIGGLATDYCVLQTTRDAISLGFDAFLLGDAIRTVNVQPDDGEKAEAEMIRLGAKTVELEDLIRAH